MSNVLYFDVYKNTLKRADGFQPVSGERGYSQICCRFRKGDWASAGNLLTGGFFVNSKQVTGVEGRVEDESGNLSATFAIPSAILRKDSAFYFAVSGSYDNGNMVVVTNAVRIDVARGMITDNITENEEIISRYDELMATLNSALEAKQDKLERGTTNEFVDVDEYGVMKRSGYRVTTNENVIADRASADGFIPNARAVAKVINAVKALIPTKTSQLQNNSGFITQHQDISGKEDKSNKVYSITQDRTGRDATVDYPTVLAVREYVEEQLDFYALEDEVPVNVSDLENDAGYITAQDIIGKVDKEQVKDIIDGVLSGVTTNVPTLLIDNTVNQQYNPDGHLIWYYIDSDGTRHNLFDFTPYIRGTGDYNNLINKPSINGVALSGNKLAADLGLQETLSQGNINEIVAAASNGTMKRSGYSVTTNENVIVDRASADGFIPNARAVAKKLSGITQIKIVSGEVDANGHIRFKDSDGNTFTTTGASVIGADGADGASVVGATINQGFLVLTLQKGSDMWTVTAGYVVGRDGTNGTNGAGYVAAEINSDGELVLTFQSAYAPGDSPYEKQVNLGRVVGATGDKGDKGDKGDTYTLTAADKTEIAAKAAGMIDISGKADKADTYTKSEVDTAIQTAIGSIETQLSQV